VSTAVASEVTLSVSALKAALGRVSHLARPGTPIEILRRTLVRHGSGGLAVMATDLDTWAEATVECEDGDAVAVVDASVLSGLVSKASTEEARLVFEDEGLTLHAGGRYRMQGMDPGEYPEHRRVEGEDWTLPAGALRHALGFVAWCQEAKGERPLFHATRLDIERGRVLATNGHTLALIGVAEAGAPGAGATITPSASAQLTRWLTDGEVSIAVDADRLTARNGGGVLTTRLVHGSYPDYTKVVPKEHSFDAEVNRAALIAACDRAALYVGRELNSKVRLTWEDGTLTVRSAQDERGESADEVPGVAGGDFAILFNVRYLQQALARLGGEKVRMQGTAPERATVWSGEDAESFYLLMPQREI
jgi:DNA polymerase-3 subunit beta